MPSLNLRFAAALLAILTLNGCKQPAAPDGSDSFVFVPPILIDTVAYDTMIHVEDEWLIRGGLPLKYVGPNADTLVVPARYIHGPLCNEKLDGKFPHLLDSGLVIHIDSSRILSAITPPFGKITHDNKFEVYAQYPVFALNRTQDTVAVGAEGFLHGEVEAMDSMGNWRLIRDNYNFICGTGVFDVVLPPAFIAIALVPIYKGSFKTRLRIRHGNIFSNEIDAMINPTQFRGEYE